MRTVGTRGMLLLCLGIVACRTDNVLSTKATPASQERWVVSGDAHSFVKSEVESATLVAGRTKRLVTPPPGYVDAVVNGGFESGFTGWTRSATGAGYNGDVEQAWMVGASDPKSYGGMPHLEPLAHSGDAGASATENGATLHTLFQDIAIVDDGTTRPVTLLFWLRWKNQSGSWQRFGPCDTPSPFPICQDVIVQLRDPVTDAPITELWSAWASSAPLFSGGGDFNTAYYQPFTFDLTAYKGQTVRLQFQNHVCCYFQYLDIDDVQLLVPSNRPPVANAGPDQVLEATAPSGAQVTLDGTASNDPDGDLLTYVWREGGVTVGTGPTPSLTLPVGTHTITLTVQDPLGLSSTDDVAIDVRDTRPPVIVATVDTTPLWPANHKMRVVAKGIAVTDIVDQFPTVNITVTSNEPVDGLGDGDTSPDWLVTRATDGTWTVELRAERAGTGNGRRYTMTIGATDRFGNQAQAQYVIRVPKSQGK